jgi:multimeric flavodoxin WrbA
LARLKNWQKGMDRLEGMTDCIIKGDHFPFLLKKMGECNGIILSFPAYSMGTPGYVMMIRDRYAGIGKEYYKDAAEKPKVGATICVCGFDGVSMVRAQTNYFLPPRAQTEGNFLPSAIKLVDQMTVLNTFYPGQVLLNDEALARARKLGQNLAKAMKTPLDEVEYVGEEYGICPICHSDLLSLRWREKDATICAACHFKGQVEMKGDSIRLVIDEKEPSKTQRKLEDSWGGNAPFSQWHDDHLQNNKNIMDANKQIISKKIEKYKAHKPLTVPPPLKVE